MEEIIGTIDFRTDLEKSIQEAVGKVRLGGKAGICDIKVKGNEGMIPHIHIENGDKFICHVCILEPLYFEHKTGESKLNKNQKEKLDEFMSQRNKKEPNLTNWHVALKTWLLANDNDGDKMKNYMQTRNIDKKEKPDYKSLDNSKSGTIHDPKK